VIVYVSSSMVQCFAADCKHNNDTENCKFYRFPKDPREFKKWTDLSRYVIVKFMVLSAYLLYDGISRPLLCVHGLQAYKDVADNISPNAVLSVFLATHIMLQRCHTHV